MLRIVLYTLVLVAGASAQTSYLAEPASLAPGDPVLFVYGLCREAKDVSREAGHCTVTVNRQQFDNVMSVLLPRGQAATGGKDRIAKTYAEVLAFASEARELGIDNSSEYRETMRWLQIKALADLLRRRLEKESDAVSDAEVEAYYREQLPRFEEVKLRRVVLPKSNFAVDDSQKFEHDVQRIAAGLRERAAHGEDPERLQKEGYQALGFSGLPPATAVGNRRRANLPTEVREEVFSLRPGDVSKVENETYGLVIYKVEAKWTLPKEQVREEITREVAKEKLDRALKSITGNIRTELNEKYFGAASAQ